MLNRLIWGCVLLLAGVSMSQATTSIGGLIATDTTLDGSGSPYIVSQPLTIDEGVTLTISPGVVLKINEQRSITVLGTLVADGTESQKKCAGLAVRHVE